MEDTVIHQLNQLNKEFYQTFARHFSNTRARVQPGVRKIIRDLEAHTQILDLGSGNGNVFHELGESGWVGKYTGLDLSETLLTIAQGIHCDGISSRFIHADLTSRDWDISFEPASIDCMFAFAVLHHIPGKNLREQIFAKAHRLLNDNGKLYLSNWQFLNSPKLTNRIQDWGNISLRTEQVDEGDYLMDWRQGGDGLRYIHYFNRTEIETLAYNTAFEIVQSFSSDGSGGNLSLYHILKKVKTKKS